MSPPLRIASWSAFVLLAAASSLSGTGTNCAAPAPLLKTRLCVPFSCRYPRMEETDTLHSMAQEVVDSLSDATNRMRRIVSEEGSTVNTLAELENMQEWLLNVIDTLRRMRQIT